MSLPTIGEPRKKTALARTSPVLKQQEEASRTPRRCPRSLLLQVVHAAVCAIRTQRTPQSRFVPHQSHLSGIYSASIEVLHKLFGRSVWMQPMHKLRKGTRLACWQPSWRKYLQARLDQNSDPGSCACQRAAASESLTPRVEGERLEELRSLEEHPRHEAFDERSAWMG